MFALASDGTLLHTLRSDVFCHTASSVHLRFITRTSHCGSSAKQSAAWQKGKSLRVGLRRIGFCDRCWELNCK